MINDGLPDKICSKCIDSVRNAFAFKQQCDIAHQTLQSFALQHNSSIGYSAVDGKVNSSEVGEEFFKEKSMLFAIEYLPESVNSNSEERYI